MPLLSSFMHVDLRLSALLFHWRICVYWNGYHAVQDTLSPPLLPLSAEGSILSEELDALKLSCSFAPISLHPDEVNSVVCHFASGSHVSVGVSRPLPTRHPWLVDTLPFLQGPCKADTADHLRPEGSPSSSDTPAVGRLCEFAGAAVIKHHRQSNLNHRNIL